MTTPTYISAIKPGISDAGAIAAFTHYIAHPPEDSFDRDKRGEPYWTDWGREEFQTVIARIEWATGKTPMAYKCHAEDFEPFDFRADADYTDNDGGVHMSEHDNCSGGCCDERNWENSAVATFNFSRFNFS